jgi:predicted AAA+ superfamily ATPase
VKSASKLPKLDARNTFPPKVNSEHFFHAKLASLQIYCADTGLAAAISFLFSDDKGRMLENLVYNELKRRHQEIYFHKYKNECDFIIKDQLEITQAIQVCFSLKNEATKKRELQGLTDALHYYPQATALIVTADEQDDLYISVGTKQHAVKIVPLWRWLLNLL